jgi:competence protein ComGC
MLMKAKIIIILFSILLMVSGCQTIKKKSDEVAEKENERFGQFIGKQVTELKMELGSPTEDYINEIGNETLVYKTKKYGIPCERKFEINTGGTIVGFTSSGCI